MKNYQVFKKPYILIEDVRNKYQPFYKEYANTDVPRLHTDSPTLCCPFQANKKYKPSTRRRQAKEGFCEVCYVRFSNYEEHIKDFEHREFAKDDNNYKKLDVFINTSVFESTDESGCDTPQSPTLKMTPVTSRKVVTSDYINDEKYGQTLHFSRASSIGDDPKQEVVPFDHFIMEILNK